MKNTHVNEAVETLSGNVLLSAYEAAGYPPPAEFAQAVLASDASAFVPVWPTWTPEAMDGYLAAAAKWLSELGYDLVGMFAAHQVHA